MNKTEANLNAEDLKKYMEAMFSGSTWNIEVWNNLDWHYKVHCGTIAIYPHHNSHGISYGIACGSEIGNTSATPSDWALGKTVESRGKLKGLVEEQLILLKKKVKEIEEISDFNYNSIIKT